ncbi:hypothetical protein C922_03031 [Plasmodium inui San Antonio 1]|uniref:Uncharacterized protein n=1 Tax=Plasmodium inui San Antonio 1 TaxID=1237626 RepID=W7AN23_9APIC|nr:hypothetical protein C922_03031 [Plasmodium inui San Antonio 1]EUD66706.1 hypothetical protein C922_03031 [Plasmodium inui San Antonio 1]
MDICISHLYNRQIRKNILQDVFYKLENYDNEEFLSFDVNSSGSLLVAASKRSLYFFHILTGTLLLQHSYYDEDEKEDYLKRNILEEGKIHSNTCSGMNDRDSSMSGKQEGVKSLGVDEGNEYDNQIENENSTSGNITRNEKIKSGEFSNILDNIHRREVGSASGVGKPADAERASHIDSGNNVDQANCVDHANYLDDAKHIDGAKHIDPFALCYHLGNNKARRSPNCDEDLKTTKEEEESGATPNTAIQNGYGIPENFLTQNDSLCNNDSVKSHKKRIFSPKGEKSKKVKKRSRQSQRNLSKSGENITNSRSRNNESNSRKSADDKFEDEDLHIMKIQFIKNDKYLLCLSKRYLYIFKICQFPITKIVYIDLLYLCIGIETVISKKLFFPCFFSEYFYLLYKENEIKQREDGSLLNNSSLSNDFSQHFGSNSHVSINKCEKISECSKNYKEIESPPHGGYPHEATPMKGHLSLFKNYYKLYTSLNLRKIRKFEICEVKCVDFKKKRRSSGDEAGNFYVLDLLLCLKEQIPYVSRVYVEEMNYPSGQYRTTLSGQYATSQPDLHPLAPCAERMNDFIVDVNETHPIISYERMNFTFQEMARESYFHARRDMFYSKSKSKNKKKYVKGGGSKNLDYNEVNGVSKVECSEGRLGEAILSEAVVEGGGAIDLVSAVTTRMPSGLPSATPSEVTIGDGKTVDPAEIYLSSRKILASESQREGASVCEEKDEEAMQLIKFFENYEDSRKFLKQMLSGYFPICVYKKRSSRRSKELPTTLNIYDNLNVLLKGATLRGNIPRGEEKNEEIFEKENDYYIFDYSGREKTDYFNFPHSLLKDKNSLKNINKHRNIDKDKHYIYVGTPSYILAFEMHYVKRRTTLDEQGNKEAESLKRNNIVYSKIECISDEIYRTYDNYLREVQDRNLLEENIELSFLFKIYLGITTPLGIAIREKGNLLCVRTSEKVFLYKVTYKYSVRCMGGVSYSNQMSVSDEKNFLQKCTTGGAPSQLENNITAGTVVNKSSPTQGEKHDNVYSYIDRICLYHTIHNPIQKEVYELCCFSENIYQSYLLVLSLKSGQYTLYIYDLKHMDLQNAVKVNISVYKGFKQIKWIKCYDMLVGLPNIGSYLLVLKNKHLNNWSFFISDFELIDSNIEVIEEENEFDIIENIQPKHKNIDDNIWKYIIIYINLFIKNKISIQNLSHPSSIFPILYTGYYKNSPMYFFYKSCYDFGKDNFLCYEVDESTEQESQQEGKWRRKKKKKKKWKKGKNKGTNNGKNKGTNKGKKRKKEKKTNKWRRKESVHFYE